MLAMFPVKGEFTLFCIPKKISAFDNGLPTQMSQALKKKVVFLTEAER